MTTTHTVAHATFTLERRYEASRAEVFRGLGRPGREGPVVRRRARRRPRARLPGRRPGDGQPPHGGATLSLESVYRDIVADRRIVFSSVLWRDDTVATVSITTVELVAEGAATQMVLTEQGTFLDGLELPAWRQEGTGSQLGALADVLA
jgi:uncharacterized protein YndB with AHSA1/START domain